MKKSLIEIIREIEAELDGDTEEQEETEHERNQG